MEVTVAGESFSVSSQFSTPAGQWRHGSNRFFRHTHRIEPRDEATVIYDTFENLTDKNLPLMQRAPPSLPAR